MKTTHHNKNNSFNLLLRLIGLTLAFAVFLSVQTLPANARKIQNCHAYTWYRLTEEVIPFIDGVELVRKLEQHPTLTFEKRVFSGTPAKSVLKPGDVIIFAATLGLNDKVTNAPHSGFVNDWQTIDHIRQSKFQKILLHPNGSVELVAGGRMYQIPISALKRGERKSWLVPYAKLEKGQYPRIFIEQILQQGKTRGVNEPALLRAIETKRKSLGLGFFGEDDDVSAVVAAFPMIFHPNTVTAVVYRKGKAKVPTDKERKKLGQLQDELLREVRGIEEHGAEFTLLMNVLKTAFPTLLAALDHIADMLPAHYRALVRKHPVMFAKTVVIELSRFEKRCSSRGPGSAYHKIMFAQKDIRDSRKIIDEARRKALAALDRACKATDVATAEAAIRELRELQRKVKEALKKAKDALKEIEDHSKEFLANRQKYKDFVAKVFGAELILGTELANYNLMVNKKAKAMQDGHKRVKKIFEEIKRICKPYLPHNAFAKTNVREAEQLTERAKKGVKPLNELLVKTPFDRQAVVEAVDYVNKFVNKLIKACSWLTQDDVDRAKGHIGGMSKIDKHTGERLESAKKCLAALKKKDKDKKDKDKNDRDKKDKDKKDKEESDEKKKKSTIKGIINIIKTADKATMPPGDKVKYTYIVRTPGPGPLTDVSISDDHCFMIEHIIGGDANADGKLDPGETWKYECSATLHVDTTNTALVQAMDSSSKAVQASSSVTVTVGVPKKKKTVEMPNLWNLTEAAAKYDIKEAGLTLGQITYKHSSMDKGEVIGQTPAPKTLVAPGHTVSLVVSKGPERKLGRLFIDPPRTTIKIDETVSFRALEIYTDGSERDVTGDPLTLWNPGPGNSFTGTEAGVFTVTATARGVTGYATVTVEEEEERTKWDKPISHSDQLTAKAPLPPPDAFTWYALCNKNSGDVVYGETTDPTKYDILGGPFPGPRTVKMWINQNIPSWRCPSLAGKRGEWNVLCDKQSYSVSLGKSTDPTKFWIMAGGFPGEPEARSWAGANCPGWMCTEGGGCASGPRGGGDWAVVCSKDHGGMALTRHPDSMTDWIFASGLLGEKDARLWVNTRCPSWRCNRDGQCMPGKRVERDEPLELPPFDDFYARQQRLLDEKADEGAMDQAMQMEGDSRTGRPGFTSKGLNKDLDKTHVYVKAECKEDKDCQEGQECKDGKCVQTPTEEIVRLEVDPPEATIPLDGEVTFKAFAILRDGKREPVKAEWDRPNPYKGEAGSDTITAKYGEFSKSATITVSDKPTTEPDKPAAEPDKPSTTPDKKEVSLLTITKEKTLVMQDETVTLVATATFKDGKKIKDTATFRASGAIIKLGKKEISTESQEISWNLKHKGKKYDGNWLEVTAKYKDASGNVASDSAMVIVCPPNCHKKRDGSFACCCD